MFKTTRVIALFVIGLATASTSFAQSEGSGEIGKEGKSRGTDKNITVPQMKNDLEAAEDEIFVQAESKGGTSRGSYCLCFFDNYTDWVISTYVDGSYAGMMGRYGSNSASVYGGSTRMYAVAEFTDGSRSWWGPVVKDCNNQKFTLTTNETTYSWTLE